MTDRQLELSEMFIKMGQTLINEGVETKDYRITQSGNIMVLLSGLLFDEDDMFMFSELSSMFSAKKVLETMQSKDENLKKNFKDIAKTYSSDELIKKISKIRKTNKRKPKDQGEN